MSICWRQKVAGDTKSTATFYCRGLRRQCGRDFTVHRQADLQQVWGPMFRGCRDSVLFSTCDAFWSNCFYF